MSRLWTPQLSPQEPHPNFLGFPHFLGSLPFFGVPPCFLGSPPYRETLEGPQVPVAVPAAALVGPAGRDVIPQIIQLQLYGIWGGNRIRGEQWGWGGCRVLEVGRGKRTTL